MTMVSRTYVVRDITEEDRAQNAYFVRNAEERGELEEAEAYRQSLLEWEKEQGQTKQRLACPVCGDSWLSPTSRGTSRPHVRHDIERPTLERARQLQRDIKVLQEELERVLSALEE
jgi:hypothetical protein